MSTEKILSDVVFKAPLTELTLKVRKNLLFTSVLSILLTIYGLKINKTPWLDIEVPKSALNILHGAISVTLIYFLIIFVFYVIEDLKRWRLAGSLLNIHNYFEITTQAKDYVSGIEYHLRNLLSKLPIDDPENKYLKDVKELISKSKKFYDFVEKDVNCTKKQYLRLSIIQWLRLLVIELGIPIFLGVIGLYNLSPSIIPFVSAIFN